MRDAPLVWSARVPADPVSPRRCRLAATDLLGRAGVDHLAPDAALLVSELVTNVLLHVGSEASVRLSVRSGTLLAEVEDQSPVLPQPQAPSQSSPTGRGLALVEGLANAWGAVPNGEGGKVIWFELGERTHTRSAPRPLDPGGTAVTLVGTPVQLALGTLDHGDAMLRELALAGLHEEGAAPAVHDGADDARLDTGPLRRTLLAAAEAGLRTATIELAVDDGAAPDVLNRLAQIDEGDRLGREGAMLAPPSLPEVALCRTWLLTEIAWQLKGAAPKPWRLPAPIESAESWSPLAPADVAAADAVADAVVLADSRNRILHLNPAAGELLGWSAAELAGRRLTLLVPPAEREAHLAGFTNHLVTGERRILGTEVAVPALTRSGEEVAVVLVVEEIVLSTGERAFRGQLRATPSVD